MVRHRTVFGRCRLCGESKILSFEHIPPRSSDNKNTEYYITPFTDILESDNPFSRKIKGKPKQGGTGNNTLCIDCNNFLGRTYVDSYTEWVNVGKNLLNSYKETPISFTIHNFEPLKIIKQILSMFISMDDENCFERHSDICKFVRNPNSNDLPEKYQVYFYLNNEGDTFYVPPSCYGNLKTGLSVVCSEIIFSPYGYVFTMNNINHLDNLINITTFKSYKLEDKVNLIFRNLHKLPKHLPIPLDYRTMGEINLSLKGGI